MEAKIPEVLNTGDVKQNNNDHVLSFDGTVLGLSSHDAERGGSVICTVPVTGGEPELITPTGPSCLHGWSPDSKKVSFVSNTIFTGLPAGE